RGMVVCAVADLNEKDLLPEVIDHRLETTEVPPFNGEIILAARDDNPKRNGPTGQLLNRGRLGLFLCRKVNVTLEARWLDLHPESCVQIINKTVQEMIGRAIGFADERIMAFQDLHARLRCFERPQVGIVLPKLRAGSADVDCELARIALVEIADRRG